MISRSTLRVLVKKTETKIKHQRTKHFECGGTTAGEYRVVIKYKYKAQKMLLKNTMVVVVVDVFLTVAYF